MLKQFIDRISLPFVNHWRGQNALFPTVIFSVLGISFLMKSIPVQASFPVACAIMVVCSMVLIWQIVGTWRAITVNLAPPGEPTMAWLGYGALLVAITVTSFQLLDQYSGDFSKPAYLRKLLKPPELLVSKDGLSISITGDIDFTTNTALLNTTAKFPHIKTVILASDGGLVYSARALAHNIIEKNLDTHIDERCASACTIVFMAGKNRTMGKTAKLGFHRYKYEINNPLRKSSLNDEQGNDTAFFKKRGVSETFLQKAFMAPHTNLWYPDKNTLVSAGIITKN
ncbi:MAG: hypothetical protein JKY82_04185 [Rhizobiaceae bacterium]|nr:hypothetical protein [Rhizobiaceae bacterium]